jgi:hypothetical protein
MSTRGYTILGWLVWQVATRVAKRKIGQNRVKLGAAAIAALALVGGVIAARMSGGES